jgi:hypothetical protein
MHPSQRTATDSIDAIRGRLWTVRSRGPLWRFRGSSLTLLAPQPPDDAEAPRASTSEIAPPADSESGAVLPSDRLCCGVAT